MGLSPGLEPNPRLSRGAQLAFYVTLGAAVVRCAQQSEPQVVAIAPVPAGTEAPTAHDAGVVETAGDAGDAALDAQRVGKIAIYGAPAHVEPHKNAYVNFRIVEQPDAG